MLILLTKSSCQFVVVTFLLTLGWTLFFSVFFAPLPSVEYRKRVAQEMEYKIYSSEDNVTIVNMPPMSERKDVRGLPGCEQRRPELLMIGVPKCGTGTVRTFLSEHPDIAMEMNSEGVQYFNARYNRGWIWYRSQMPCSKKGQITAENSVQYFVSSVAPERIAQYSPSMKLIVTLRDPIKRLESEFMQMVVGRPQYLSGVTIEENVLHPLTGEVNAQKTLVTKSVYIMYLKIWLDFFDKSQIHLVDGDEFAANPVKELSQIEDFLGVRNYFNISHFAFVESRGFFCLNRSDYVECLEGGKGRPHPHISPSVLRKLKNYYKPFNEELFETFGKRFNWN